jgi:hypothetical protein
VAVSVKPVPMSPVDPKDLSKGQRRDRRKLTPADWKELKQSELELPSSDFHFDKIFTRTDRETIALWVIQMHEPNPATVEAGMGEALPVSGV